MDINQIISNLYVSVGVFGIVLAMAIESCCIPLPSEIVMPVAGFMLADGKLLPGTNTVVGLVILALAGSIGSLLGSSLAYWIGYKGGRPLMLKYGRYVLISQHDADLADRFFARWGSPTAFFSRLLPVVRTYISLPAGITKMPFGKFCLYTFLGSFPWCLLLAYIGYVLHGNIKPIEPYFNAAKYVIVLLIVVLVALYLWRHIRNDRKARAEHAANANAQIGQQHQPNWNQAQPIQSQQPNWNQPSPQQQWSQDGQAQQGWNQPPVQQYPPQQGYQNQQPGYRNQPQQPSQPPRS